MKFLRALAFLLLAWPAYPGASAAPELAPQLPLPPSRDLYSFADLYRLTAGEPALPAHGTAFQVQVRTVAGDAPALAAAAPYVFSIGTVAAPSGGLLALAGLAAALWVARRRLGYAIRG